MANDGLPDPLNRWLQEAGEECRATACAARRDWPIAPEKRSFPEQAAFHMRAVLMSRLG
jgi:hypothetical protein